MAESEGSLNQFDILKGFRPLGFDDVSLIDATVTLNKAFPGAFSYSDIKSMDWEYIEILVSHTKANMK